MIDELPDTRLDEGLVLLDCLASQATAPRLAALPMNIDIALADEDDGRAPVVPD